MAQRRRMMANIDTNLIDPSMFYRDYITSAGVLQVNYGTAKSIRFPCKPNTQYIVTGKQTGENTYLVCHYGFFNVATLTTGTTTTSARSSVSHTAPGFSFTTSADTIWVIITNLDGIQDFTKWVIREG